MHYFLPSPPQLNTIYRLDDKIQAFALFHYFGYMQIGIAEYLRISPQQLGQWIREIEYLTQSNPQIGPLIEQCIDMLYQRGVLKVINPRNIQYGRTH